MYVYHYCVKVGEVTFDGIISSPRRILGKTAYDNLFYEWRKNKKLLGEANDVLSFSYHGKLDPDEMRDLFHQEHREKTTKE